MRLKTVGLCVMAIVLSAGVASAQSTTGTISGHVSDAQGLALPGVTVSVTSPNLQGIRNTVTSAIGDYVVTLLPPGAYTLTFELSGFQKQEKRVVLAPTQTLPVDAVLGPASLTEQVTVVGTPAHVFTQTAQVATNLDQDLIATLPTNRDLNASVLQAPAVHATGPSGAYSIAGFNSFESLFMVNGVAITENLRGTPYTLYIEDAIEETTVAVGGVSADTDDSAAASSISSRSRAGTPSPGPTASPARCCSTRAATTRDIRPTRSAVCTARHATTRKPS